MDNMKTNEFAKMRLQVQEAVDKYEKIRKECQITNSWHSETIKRLAIPFLKGHFTLAVVGKMSSGKSTFINALIGKNVLPTGHFQTTSAITYIQPGPKYIMKVVYCDGHNETIKTNIEEKLNSLVAVPDEYSLLPVNDINRLISGGDNVSEILRKKAGIEKKTKCAVVEDSIWKKYIMEHKPSVIAKEVYIECPLSEEFDGWRIVDTPGIGAIGGIQDETKKLFFTSDNNGYKNVDAIVFLHSGADNIEDESARDFMEEMYNELTEDAKKRLFFVLTKASEREFRTYKDELLHKANSLFAKVFAIDSNRVTYVDSLLHRFCNELTDKEDFGDIESLDGWTTEDLNAMTDLYTPIKKVIKANGEEMNNESISRIMKEWSNFDKLKKMINDFVREEKTSAINKLLRLIETDYKGFTNYFQGRIKLLEDGIPAMKQEHLKIKKDKAGYDHVLNLLRREATTSSIWPEFDFIDARIEQFSNKPSISLIRTAYLDLIKEVTTHEEAVFDKIKNKFYEHCKNHVSNGIVLQSIDFDELENQAEITSTHTVTDMSRPKTELVKRGGWSSDDEYKTTYPYTKQEVDFEEKRREFAIYVKREARKAKSTFETQLKNKIEVLYKEIKKDVDAKIENAINDLASLESQIGNKEYLIQDYNKKIHIVNQ